MTHPYPYLNLGSGKVHLPCAKPDHHSIVPDEIYSYPYWLNIDHSTNVGADMNFDLFTYPWPLPSDSYDGALLAHIVEHIPHPIHIISNDLLLPHRANELRQLPDGFYAFFSELYRVLRHDAVVHVLVPYGLSLGAFQDPTHTRYIVPQTFSYLTPNPDAPFEMNFGSHFKRDGMGYTVNVEMVKHMLPISDDMSQDQREKIIFDNEMALLVTFNAIGDMLVSLKVVKE